MTNKALLPNKLTQVQRSELSKQRLIDACTQSLIEHGYAQISTQVICDKAGLSKGGLFRQFPSRTDLMIATTKCMYDSLITQFETQYHETKDPESKSQKVATLIQKIFNTDTFQAVLEITIASRTDPKLKKGLIPIIQKNTQTVFEIARTLFPDAAVNNPKFDAVIHLLIIAFQGEIIDDLIYNTEGLAQARFNLLVEITERELERQA